MNDEVIFSYTADQAIEDGALVHPYPTKFPWLLITAGIHTTCKNQQGRNYDQSLVPLLMDCVMAVRAKKNPEFPVVLMHTVAGEVWVMPNEKGGITVMNPEDY